MKQHRSQRRFKARLKKRIEAGKANKGKKKPVGTSAGAGSASEGQATIRRATTEE